MSASSSCGPGREFRPLDGIAQWLQLLLEQALRLQQDQGAVFLEADADDLVVRVRCRRDAECDAAGNRDLQEVFQEAIHQTVLLVPGQDLRVCAAVALFGGL